MARHDQNGRTQESPPRRVRLPDSPLSGRGRDAEKTGEKKSSPRAARDSAPIPQGRGKVTWPSRTKQLRPLKLDVSDAAISRRREEKEQNPGDVAARRRVQSKPPVSPKADRKPETKPGAKPESKKPVPTRAEPVSSPPKAKPPEARSAKDKKEPLPAKRGTAKPAPRPLPDGQPSKPPKKESFGVKVARILFGAVICALAAGFYLLWARQTADEAMPPMVMPEPYFYEEEQPVRALLLWREKVIVSPASGTVQLTSGEKPAPVASGDVVATVMARGGTTRVRAPARGYFVPAIDGAEDTWDYPTLWLGSGLLPNAPPVSWIKDLGPLRNDRVVGKLIYLPQNPRAIFYLNLTDKLREGLKRGSISIRRESKGPKWPADVRVYVTYGGQRAKVALDMPYFPLEMALSRQTNFLVCSDEETGLVVPDSAVVLRSGTYGVFELVGDRLVFRSVTGKPVKGDMFFVSSGLSPGNPVILNAADAEEKRVRLW